MAMDPLYIASIKIPITIVTYPEDKCTCVGQKWYRLNVVHVMTL